MKTPLFALVFMLLVSGLRAYETVPDGKWWETGGAVYYVKSSMNNLYVSDGTNQTSTIDVSNWFRRVGEVLLIEKVPYNGFTTATYYSGGVPYVYYKIWTTPSHGDVGQFPAYKWDDGTGGVFLPVWGGSNCISLQASNGQYLVADWGGASTVSADRGGVGDWEQFTAWWSGTLQDGTIVYLTSRNFQKFITAEVGNGDPLMANGTSAGLSQKHKIYKVSGSVNDQYIRAGDQVGFQSDEGLGRFWSADWGGGYGVRADRPGIGSWETFTIDFVTPNPR